MVFQTPFLFYEYKTEKLCFKIDHAHRQKKRAQFGLAWPVNPD